MPTTKNQKKSMKKKLNLLGLLFRLLLVASNISAAEAGGEAARIVFETVNVSSLTSGSPETIN